MSRYQNYEEEESVYRLVARPEPPKEKAPLYRSKYPGRFSLLFSVCLRPKVSMPCHISPCILGVSEVSFISQEPLNHTPRLQKSIWEEVGIERDFLTFSKCLQFLGRGDFATMGREVEKPKPDQFLHKFAKTAPLPPPTVSAEKKSTKPKTKPAIPSRTEQPVMGLVSQKNYVTANAVDNILAVGVFLFLQRAHQNSLGPKSSCSH